MSAFRARRLLEAAGALLIAGCSLPSPSPATPLATATPSGALAPSLDAGRYAVQWTAYLGVTPGQTAYVQLGFIDFDGPGAHPDEAPEMLDVVLLTDRGEVPATVETIVPNERQGPFRLFTALLLVDPPGIGQYAWNRIRYRDHRGVHEISVGRWTLEVRAGMQNDLSEDGVSLGASAFGQVEATLANRSRDSITIRGLDFDLPGEEVEVTMTHLGAGDVEPSPTDAGSSSSQPPDAGGEPVEVVTIDPGGAAEIAFRLRPRGSRDRFGWVQVQPFVEYVLADDGKARWFGLGPQLYSMGFPDTSAIEAYVQGLPPDAFHPVLADS